MSSSDTTPRPGESHPVVITPRSMLRNSAWNMAGQLLPFVGALVAIPTLLHQLGVARLGIVLLAWILAGTASFFDLGLGRATTRLVAGVPHEDGQRLTVVIWASLVLMTAVGVVFSVLLFVAAPFLAAGGFLSIPADIEQEAVAAVRVLALAIPFVTASACLRGALEARQRFDLVNFVRAPAGILTYLGPVVATTFVSRSLPAAMVGLVAARVFTLAAYGFASRRVVPRWYSNRVDLPILISVARFGAWLSVSGVAGPAVAQLDKFVIGSLLSVAAVSYYGTPYEVATKVWVIPGALAGVLFAAFSALDARKDRAQSRKVFVDGFSYLLAALLVCSVGMIALGPWALGVWLGPGFAAHSSLVLQILAVGVFANSLAYVPAVYIQGSGRPDLTAKLYFAELVPYFAALWVAIHFAGVEGAAVAWTLRCGVDAAALLVLSGVRLEWPARMVRRVFAISIFASAFLVGAVVLRPLLGPMLYGALLVAGLVALLAVTFWFMRSGPHEPLTEVRCPCCGSPGRPFMSNVTEVGRRVAGSWSLLRCSSSDCGAAWLWPMPAEAARSEFYRNYYTHGATSGRKRPAILESLESGRLASLGYDTGGQGRGGWSALLTALHPGGRAELDAGVMYLTRPRAGQAAVLDVGCGNGALMERLAGLGWAPIGIDPDEAAVAQARSRGLDARVGTLADQGFPDDSFDAIVSSHVIEHTDLPSELLEECQRILKPGGVLVFVTPNLDSLCRRAFGPAWSSLDPPRHLVLHTSSSLRGGAIRAHLEVVSCGSTARYARSVVNLSTRLLLRGHDRDQGVGKLGQLLAVPVQLLERALIAFGVDCGEELRLIARKGDHGGARFQLESVASTPSVRTPSGGA